ncbi:hypothetical protein ACLS0R_11590 [Comamonas jiangduensis]|uniref:hypothetical protein n=1 Tax=Comamonas jiangduensis TaxID=1194168 RepID=UPI001C58CF98|nr:hypothetical protein KXJ72_11315 [Comamonas aquatica]
MPSIASDKEWQIEDDMRTLVRAAEIRKDPKRLKAAQQMAKKRAEELNVLTQKASDKK